MWIALVVLSGSSVSSKAESCEEGKPNGYGSCVKMYIVDWAIYLLNVLERDVHECFCLEFWAVFQYR